VGVSVVGLVGDPQSTTRSLTEIGPQAAADTFSGPIESIASNQSAAGFAFVLGLAVALWSASGYIGAFTGRSDLRHVAHILTCNEEELPL
jgi:membrane protein